MDNVRIIASSLSDNELAQAFAQLAAERWDNWDFTPYLPYLVDTCAPTVLPFLAEQFDIDGLRGFAMAVTIQQQRELIKRSIALHKYMGTPWAIREACRTVGFPVIMLEEGVTAIPGGESDPNDWARFRVIIQINDDRVVTQEEARKLRYFVESYKNARSHLVELGFYQPLTDEHMFRDDVTNREALEVLVMSLTPNPVMINPRGDTKFVTVETNAPWLLYNDTFDWDDGTTDKFTLQYTGAMGRSNIAITSDPNDTADREKTIDIMTADGRLFGQLTIKQNFNWNNAYSRAYSKAYNNFDNIRRLAVSPDIVDLPPKDGAGISEVESNLDWDIE